MLRRKRKKKTNKKNECLDRVSQGRREERAIQGRRRGKKVLCKGREDKETRFMRPQTRQINKVCHEREKENAFAKR